MNRWVGWWLVLGATGVCPVRGNAQVVGPTTGGATALAQAARMGGKTKRVLMIAAHPDDEDTELLTYLVRHEGAVTAYLSLTRGEGGQNLIGPELGEALGLIRTEELLAARALDGAQQYFTRAFDFGFSKSVDEAFRFWPRDTLLKDVVRIVRRFRPQIIVSIFSGTPRDGHGQHQAAGWAAQEAFKVAGDPARFPELEREEGLTAWAPQKLYRSARFDNTGDSKLSLDGGLLDPEVGQSYRQIAMRGRSLHRSQDMGMLQEVGPSPIQIALLDDRTGAGPAFFAGIDTTVKTVGIEATDLGQYRGVVAAGRAGVVVDAIADGGSLVAGQGVGLTLSVWNAGSMPTTARFGLSIPNDFTLKSDCLDRETTIEAGTVRSCAVVLSIGSGVSPTVPYFLDRPRNQALYRWTGSVANWGLPFDPPAVRATFRLQANETSYQLEREVVYRYRDQALGEVRRSLAVVPRVDVRVSPAIKVWSTRDPAPQPITVALHHSGRDSTAGTVSVDLPVGWAPVASQPFRLNRPDERRTLRFMVKPPPGLAPGEYLIRAAAADGAGRRYEVGTIAVSYSHIRERSYLTPATVAVHAAAAILPKQRKIGYVRGAADRVPEALAGVGLDVELLDGAALERADLGRFDVIVIGSRAYETDQSLIENNGRLLDYVKRGGHLLVQYQQHPFFRGNFAPYPLSVAPQHDRVTDETAPMRILRPDEPIFRAPNRIEEADFAGWVQERGLYFAHTWDPRYRPLLESHDPGGPPLEGGLLIAVYGKGTYLYSGLSFFRQLTAGVPGAFRLFLNLLDVQSRASVP